LKYKIKKRIERRNEITAADNEINQLNFFLSPNNGIKTAEIKSGRRIRYSILTFISP
jgi:hypothetical protein